MLKIWTTKTFTVIEYHIPNGERYITASNNGSIGEINKEGLKELRYLVDKILAELEGKEKPTFLRV